MPRKTPARLMLSTLVLVLPIMLALIMATAPFTTASQTPVSIESWFTQGDIACGRVTLIFNIGLGETPSETVLRTLTEKGVDATMFPTGTFARNQPEYLHRLDEAGFEIGVHDDAPLAPAAVSDEAILTGIRVSIASIENVIGREIDPYLTSEVADERMATAAASGGVTAVRASVVAPDIMPSATEDAVYRAVVDSVYPGAIIQLHIDGPATEMSTALALPRIVDDLRARGYEFVPIGQMLEPCAGTPVEFPQTVTMSGLDVHGLHCKSAPSQGATLIRILLNGDTVAVRGPAFDGWLPVQCAGQPGWIKADALPDAS